jgi:hypothetical protein
MPCRNLRLAEQMLCNKWQNKLPPQKAKHEERPKEKFGGILVGRIPSIPDAWLRLRNHSNHVFSRSPNTVEPSQTTTETSPDTRDSLNPRPALSSDNTAGGVQQEGGKQLAAKTDRIVPAASAQANGVNSEALQSSKPTQDRDIEPEQSTADPQGTASQSGTLPVTEQQKNKAEIYKAPVKIVDGLEIADREDPPPQDINLFDKKIRCQLWRLLGDLKGSKDERKDKCRVELMMAQSHGCTTGLKPTIVVFCASEKRKKEVTSKLNENEQQKWLQPFGFDVKVLHIKDGQVRYLSHPPSLHGDAWLVYKQASASDSATSGTLIRMVADSHRLDPSLEATATLGGLISIDSFVFGLTVAHPLVKAVVASNVTAFPSTGDLKRLPRYPNRFPSWGSTSQRSKTGTERSHGQSSIGSVMRYKLNYEIDDKSLKDSEDSGVNENADWALIAFNGDEYTSMIANAEQSRLTDQYWGMNGFDLIQQADRFSRDVIIETASKGPLKGVLSLSRASLDLEGSYFTVHRIVLTAEKTLGTVSSVLQMAIH